MAPLPAPEFDQPASSAIASFSRLVADVENTQIPRLRSCDSSLAVQQQLHAELHADLDSLARLAEELDELAPDQRGPRAKRELASLAASFRADIARLRKDARAALLASKRAIDANAASSRAELFKRSSAARDKPATSEAKTAEDALMKTNADVTDALRRTLHLMQSELEKSVLSAQMLESSTSTLQSATAQHDVLTDLLGTSKQLVTALERTDWLDRVLIVAGLLFFVSVVLFVLKQRIVDRGIRIAFFWTRWLPSAGGGVADVEKGVLATTTTTTTTASLVTAATTAVTTAVAGSLSGTLLSSTLAPDLDSALPTAAAIGPKLTDEDGVDSVPHDEL